MLRAILRVLYIFLLLNTGYGDKRDLLVLTVATEHNNPLERFLRSALLYDYNVKVLGQGVDWRGGDVAMTAGGGQKVNILKAELKNVKERDDLLILFVDSYDVVFMQSKEKLLKAYDEIGSKVVFAAEGFCWPKPGLESLYPTVEVNEKRFLNSGGFIGPASYLYNIVSAEPIEDDDDDQLYYTNIFLDKGLRKKQDIQLDKRSRIFQNLNGAFDDVELLFNEETGYLYNKIFSTKPIIAHGNGPIKERFNSLTNYLSNTWTPEKGCQHCSENNIVLKGPETYPTILLSVFIDVPTPFMSTFFERISNLSYPKNKIHVMAYVMPSAISELPFVIVFNNTHGSEYLTSNWIKVDHDDDIVEIRKHAFAYCLAIEVCDFVFSVSPVAQLITTDIIEHLVMTNRSVVTPLMVRRGRLWSNFWGALAEDGFYARSDDYLDILEGARTGIWNVPFVRDIYLLSRYAIGQLMNMPNDASGEFEMAIASALRKKNIFMMVDNRRYFGYLLMVENRTTDHLHNDLWELFENPIDWEEHYLDPAYSNYRGENITMHDFMQPCPDVFWIPLLTRKFCSQLIEEMEYFGKWSDGSNKDSRLEGGYENVPTRDIHMRQVEWEEHWIEFLRRYVYPIQKTIFQGHDDYPWARMNFVVRYKPGEQSFLRPHHDASSYTLNIALNEPGVDYEGGGMRFLRYNCSIIETRLGWAAISPGRVTHLHEGLRTTNGTRYIFITFVNP